MTRRTVLALHRVFAASLLSLAGADVATGDEPSLPVTGPGDPRLAPLDDLMTGFLAEHRLPGAALAVAREGRLVYARGFGYADAGSRAPVKPDARFRIASLSKPITAVMVMRLVAAERLSLDQPAFALLAKRLDLDGDECGDPRLAEVTIEQLLRHRGGFDRGVSFDPMFRSSQIVQELELDEGEPAGAEDVIRFLWRRPLDFAPDERSAYSNFGYCVLGRVIEVVTRKPYERAVRDELLRPLGIDGMRIGASRESGRAPGEVHYHVPDDRRVDSVWPRDGQVPSPYGGWHHEAMDAHGGWIASAPELVRFAVALDDDAKPALLDEDARAAMWSPHPDDSGEAAFYACGWSVRPVGARANHWHLGALEGTSTLLVRRHDGYAWAVLFNSLGDNPIMPAAAIDPLVHRAVDRVKEWPKGRALDRRATLR